MAPDGWQHLVTIDVTGLPATFATAREAAWKQAVDAAFVAWAATEPERDPAAWRYSVEVEFRLGPSRHAGEVWDIDNLVKPTLDAMAAVLGARQWQGRPQPADDRVDRLVASKRQPRDHEQPGATIAVSVRSAALGE